MNMRWISVALLVASLPLVAAKPARAQISSVVDTGGKRVFINEDSPQKHSGSTMNGAAAHSASSKNALATSTPGQTLADDGLDRIVHDAAARHQVDPALVKAVISTESGGNPTAISRKGAMG